MRRKVTFKVFTPLLHEVESQLEASHMRRDSFINHLLNCELPHLEKDLNGKRLSLSARRFIARSLKNFGTSQINVQIDYATAERLDKLTHKFNFVRDSFINRLLYFLVGSAALIKYFDVRTNNSAAHDSRHQTGFFKVMHEIQADPLANLRKLVKGRHNLGLYLAPLPVELAGFECYLEDEIFWQKYRTASDDSASVGDVLQSFESTIYHYSIHRRATIDGSIIS